MTSFGKAPDCWKKGTYVYGVGLPLDAAKNMLEAGIKEAEKQQVPMSMAICDAGGNLLAFQRMDNAMLGSIQIAMDKAFTAIFGKQATGNFGYPYKTGELIPLFYHERWITFHGGYPIIKDGVIVGGLGVSGGIVEDNYVAKAILVAGGFDTSVVDKLINDYEAGNEV